jgi:general secretion pathway protein G
VKWSTKQVDIAMKKLWLAAVGMLIVLLAIVVALFLPRGETKSTPLRQEPASGLVGFVRAAVAPRGMIASALGVYKLAMGRYPTTDEGLTALVQPPTDEDARAKWTKAGGPFIEKMNDLLDPWHHAYVYKCPGQHNKDGYDLSSGGPDGKPGTDDDITNWGT